MKVSNRNHRLTTIALLVLAASGIMEGTAAAADWSQWRGPDRSNRSPETGLLRQWPADGPPLLWKLTGLGDGIASVSVARGRLYSVGYREDGEYAFALDARTGQSLWATWIGPLAQRESPQMRWLSQRSPTVAEDKLFTITRTGELHCLEAASGRRLWSRSYQNDFGSTMPMFGFGDHPLVDGEKLICTPGAPDASIVALRKDTGELLWKSVVPNSGAGAYAALVVSEAAGVRQYVTFLERTLVGIDSKDGRLLWRYAGLSSKLNQLTPIVQGDHLFCANAFRGNDVAWLRIVREGGGLRVEERYRKMMPLQYLQDCAVQVGGQVYSWRVSPFCIDISTGQMLWGQERGISEGSGAVTAADGHLYYRTSDGFVFLVEASPEAYREKGRFQIPGAVKAIGATSPVIAEGRLYLRDNDRLFCYSVTENAGDAPLPQPRELTFELSVVSSPGSAAARLLASASAGGLEAIFVPTPQDVVEQMLALAEVSRTDLVYDLGSGDGRIVITAARDLGARAVGYELDERLVKLSRATVLQHGLEELVQIKQKDLFAVDLSEADVIATYLPSPLLQRLLPQLRKLKPGARIVSHQFPIPGIPAQRTESLQSREDGESHQLYLWKAPLSGSQPLETSP